MVDSLGSCRVESPPAGDKHVDHPKIGWVEPLTCVTPFGVAARRSRRIDPRCKDGSAKVVS